MEKASGKGRVMSPEDAIEILKEHLRERLVGQPISDLTKENSSGNDVINELVSLGNICLALGIGLPKAKLEEYLERLRIPKIG
jgi:hypothetical protein